MSEQNTKNLELNHEKYVKSRILKFHKLGNKRLIEY